MEVTVIPFVISTQRTIPEWLVKGLKNQNERTNGDHPDSCIIRISQNTEDIPGDLRRLAATETPVKKHQLMQVGKNCQRSKVIQFNIKKLIAP